MKNICDLCALRGDRIFAGLSVLLLVMLLAGCEKSKVPSPFHASDIGAMFTEADFRGKAVAVFFGYTHCPDVCPTTLADLARAMRLLGKDADRVQVLFVTVDPERDMPEMLAQYA